mgnify:CR=1 FL=1
MEREGPKLEALTHRLAETPADFLAEPRVGKTGTVNVAAVVHDLLALLGVWSLAPDQLWGGVAGLRVSQRPYGTLTLLAKTLPPIGILIAIYMCWVGATEPGGAFQGVDA